MSTKDELKLKQGFARDRDRAKLHGAIAAGSEAAKLHDGEDARSVGGRALVVASRRGFDLVVNELVQLLATEVDKPVLFALITRAGGEVADR